jgi:hypothetical protein
MDKIAQMVMSIAGIPQPLVLSIDRANWSFGNTHFNILMLCAVYEGIGYPLMWTMLDKKKGSSNSTDLIYCAVFSLFPPNLPLSQGSAPYIFCPVLKLFGGGFPSPCPYYRITIGILENISGIGGP